MKRVSFFTHTKNHYLFVLAESRTCVTFSWIMCRILDTKPFTCSVVSSWVCVKPDSSSSMPSLNSDTSDATGTVNHIKKVYLSSDPK